MILYGSSSPIVLLAYIIAKPSFLIYKDVMNRTRQLVRFVDPTHILQWARAQHSFKFAASVMRKCTPLSSTWVDGWI